MFQKLMDTVQQGIRHVICYIDDILVTGSNEEQHLRNLATVFGRLQTHGFRLKKNKCSFLQDSVVYLGHKIDSACLHAGESRSCRRRPAAEKHIETSRIPRDGQLLQEIHSELVINLAPTEFSPAALEEMELVRRV